MMERIMPKLVFLWKTSFPFCGAFREKWMWMCNVFGDSDVRSMAPDPVRPQRPLAPPDRGRPQRIVAVLSPSPGWISFWR